MGGFYNSISRGMLEPPTTCLTCETENQMMNVKSLTPGGVGQRNSNGQVSTVGPVWLTERGGESVFRALKLI